MKLWRCHDEIRASSDEIFGVPPHMISSLRSGKSASFSCRKADFTAKPISSTEGRFLPQKADLVEKKMPTCLLALLNHYIIEQIRSAVDMLVCTFIDIYPHTVISKLNATLYRFIIKQIFAIGKCCCNEKLRLVYQS